MTLLEIMIVLAILALVMALLVGPRVLRMFSESKVSTTKIQLRKFVYEAYPHWLVTHPGKDCPGKLSEIDENSENPNKEPTDPWGQPIRMLCGASLPAGARGFAVVSYGPDGKPDTEDDLKSWDLRDE